MKCRCHCHETEAMPAKNTCCTSPVDALYEATDGFLSDSGFKALVIGGTIIQRRVGAPTDAHNELVIKFLGTKKKKAKRK